MIKYAVSIGLYQRLPCQMISAAHHSLLPDPTSWGQELPERAQAQGSGSKHAAERTRRIFNRGTLEVELNAEIYLDSELGVVVSRNCSLVLLCEQCKTLGMMSKVRSAHFGQRLANGVTQ